jgi:hypothetical protein
MTKLFGNTARTLGVIAAVSAGCAFAMTFSLPYRIHQGIYTWYLWTERLLPFMSLTALERWCPPSFSGLAHASDYPSF